MIQEFITKFDAARGELLKTFLTKHPDSYEEVVREVIKVIAAEEDYGVPDPERIHEIDDGDCQGTLLFVIAAKGYQPSDYWYARVGYGSCSGCDTLQDIRGYSSATPTTDQAEAYCTLALHILQNLKKLEGWWAR